MSIILKYGRREGSVRKGQVAILKDESWPEMSVSTHMGEKIGNGKISR